MDDKLTVSDRISLDTFVLTQNTMFSKIHEKHHAFMNSFLALLFGVIIALSIGFFENHFSLEDYFGFIMIIIFSGVIAIQFFLVDLSRLEESFRFFCAACYLPTELLSDIVSDFTNLLQKFLKSGTKIKWISEGLTITLIFVGATVFGLDFTGKELDFLSPLIALIMAFTGVFIVTTLLFMDTGKYALSLLKSLKNAKIIPEKKIE